MTNLIDRLKTQIAETKLREIYKETSEGGLSDKAKARKVNAAIRTAKAIGVNNRTINRTTIQGFGQDSASLFLANTAWKNKTSVDDVINSGPIEFDDK